MIRLGLIGPGTWGKNYIAAVRGSGNAELSWVASRDWMEQPKVDGIIVATPPGPRANIIRSQSGVPMMVEKPLCLALKEAEMLRTRTILVPGVLVAEVPMSDIFLVDYVHLFSPAFEELRNRFRISPAASVYIHVESSSPTVRDYSLLWDQAPHALAMILALGFTVEDAVVHGNRLTLKLSNNGFARVFVSTGETSFRFSVEAIGFDALYDRHGTLDAGGERIVEPSELPLMRAVRAFAKAIEDGGTDDWRFGIESSVEITRVLEVAGA
jgi:predicted dehydrogenase